MGRGGLSGEGWWASGGGLYLPLGHWQQCCVFNMCPEFFKKVGCQVLKAILNFIFEN